MFLPLRSVFGPSPLSQHHHGTSTRQTLASSSWWRCATAPAGSSVRAFTARTLQLQARPTAMKHDTQQLCMRIPTYPLLTCLDKYYVTYGYRPRFDLVAERCCLCNHRLRLGANTPQRYRVVTIRNALHFPLTDDPAPYFRDCAGYSPWPPLWPYSALSST